jgi:hypothetical protein
LKRTTLLTLIKRGLLALTAGLWLEECYETFCPPRWLTPGRDRLLDSVLVVLSFLVIAWFCTECVVRAMDRKAAAVASVIDATAARAGFPAGPRDSGPHPRPRLVEDRETA